LIKLIFQYDKRVKYSINAILASVDKLNVSKVYLSNSFEESLRLAGSSSKEEKCVYAVSLLTTMLADESYLSSLIRTVQKIREKGCLTVIGGAHASGDPYGALSVLGFDYAIIGEGERTFTDFLTALEDNVDVHGVKGLAYRSGEDGTVSFTGRGKPENLDEYDPFPYWRGIVNPIEITRGCSFGCFYCQVSYLHGFTLRHRSIDRIATYAEIALKLGFKDLRFISPDSLSYGLPLSTSPVNLEKIESLMEGLHAKTVKYGGRIFYGTFPSEVRPEHAQQDVLRTIRKYVANRELIIGGQSGSERILKLIRRGHGVDEIELAVESALREGFTPSVDFIIGFPSETEEDMLQTLKLAEKLVGKGARIHLHYYIPLPGTPLGLRKPAPLPVKVRKEWSRLVGAGKAYGSWLTQEILGKKIIELFEKGIIHPRQAGLTSAQLPHLSG
jgi:B12-binding domain/radical SAM domain protein